LPAPLLSSAIAFLTSHVAFWTWLNLPTISQKLLTMKMT
jgi:hypothetical protein